MEHLRANNKALETSIVTMINNRTGQEVCLTSMIHIGKESYYKEIFEILNKNEEVFYEMIGKSKESTLKSKLIFMNTLKLSDFYRDIAIDVHQENRLKISKAMNTVRLDKSSITSHTAKDYNTLIQKVIKDNKVIFQWDMTTTQGYNYKNLPKHRHNADLNADEITKNTPIFSKDNLKALGMKIGLWFMRVARFFGRKFKMDDIMKIADTKDKEHLDIDTPREDIVVNKILQSKSKSIGVAYGAWHIESIKQRLIEHGFEEKGDRKYLKALSKDVDFGKQHTEQEDTMKIAA